MKTPIPIAIDMAKRQIRMDRQKIRQIESQIKADKRKIQSLENREKKYWHILHLLREHFRYESILAKAKANRKIQIKWAKCDCGCEMHEIHGVPKVILGYLEYQIKMGYTKEYFDQWGWPKEIEIMMKRIAGSEKNYRRLGQDNIYVENGIIYSI